MPAASLVLDWESTPSGLPLFQRIAESIASEIRRGRLTSGARLPSSRRLAQDMGVHRNTILAAYDELASRGYVTTEPAKGTFVTDEVPTPSIDRPHRRRREGSPVPLRLAPPPLAPPEYEMAKGALPLLGGLPDLRELPTKQLLRAYRAALDKTTQTLDYQGLYGQRRFLQVLARHLAESRGVVAGQGELLVTRGSQQALYLAARALVRPGSVLAVERAGYPPAWEAFRLSGAELRPIRTDSSGLVVEDLARLCEREDIAAVYVTPHHQYPTTVTMSGPRRMALLQLAERAKFVIIEDDYDHEFHFSSQPVLPLASADPRRVVLHIGTLSKVFAPGLRVGYAVGQPELIRSMAHTRAYIDRQGDHTMECALATMMEDGEFGAHVRRMHRTYGKRREVLFSALEKELGDVLSFERPSGGLAVWTRIECAVSAQAWAERAADRGVIVQAAQRFFLDGRDRRFFRLGYARLNEAELVRAVRLLAASRPRTPRNTARSRP